MPVTARLLRKFSESLGEDATNDLIDWFAQTDTANRSELGDLKRHIDVLEQRIADFKAELRVEIATLRSDMMKWMFIFWAGTVIPLAGLIIALNKL